ncbi:hypothetical protein F7725_024460 [Dissostichus mawsoni]|uniref:Uncharacterized protein n=1 Tax=Dissostichus mawsoni TaxID=36200 RepID=A0A7J5Y0X5_DISMA|nr:hypothetical protein F7725_024460 [Dissostichus mawsoni]
MSSPEEEAPDLQLSFVFGNIVVKPQNPHILPEDEEAQEPPEHYSTETLCLSRTQLKHVAESILKNSMLKATRYPVSQIQCSSACPTFCGWTSEITTLHRSLLKLACTELPVVEKLQLSELMGSSTEEQDESVDEDEMKRFRELKQKMILLDKAELGSTAQGDGNQKPPLLPIVKRKKATTKAASIPELPLFDSQHRKRPEERRPAAMKELNEKQAIVEQRRKSHDALNKWRTEAKTTQKKKMPEQKKHAEQRNQEEAVTDSKPSVEDGTRELEQQICARVEKMQERRRNPRGTVSEQMAVAEKDVEEMRKLQAQLLQRKKNWGIDLQKHFTIVTGDNLPSFIDK